MTNYRIFSSVIKNNAKKKINVNISRKNKINNEFLKNNKEPLNISIMDPDFSKNFWIMQEKIYLKKK